MSVEQPDPSLASLAAQIRLLTERVDKKIGELEPKPPLRAIQDISLWQKLLIGVIVALLFLIPMPSYFAPPVSPTPPSLLDKIVLTAVVSMLFIVWLYTPPSMYHHGYYGYPNYHWPRMW